MVLAGANDGVGGAAIPIGDSVFGTGDADRFVLLSPGAPHVVDDVRTHDGNLFPRLFGGKNRIVARTLPRFPILAGGIANLGLASYLPGIPHLVAAAVLADNRAVQLVLPIGLVVTQVWQTPAIVSGFSGIVVGTLPIRVAFTG